MNVPVYFTGRVRWGGSATPQCGPTVTHVGRTHCKVKSHSKSLLSRMKHKSSSREGIIKTKL
eukprot:3976261-Amphidinium_carterae.1